MFLRAAERTKPGFAARMREVLALPVTPKAQRLASPRGVHWLVVELAGQTPVGELSSQLGVDRTTLSRWLRGSTEPRLPERQLDLHGYETRPAAAPVALFGDQVWFGSGR